MEKDIIYNALEQLKCETNLTINLEFQEEGQKYDGIFIIESLSNTVRLNLEVKRNLTLSKLPSIKNFSRYKNTILVSDYIPKTMKDFLRKEKISYLDIVGNAYIENEHFFIFIEKNKNIRNAFKTRTRAFSKSGLKVIYQLLINENMLNMSYRHIGKKSKVSIDTVGKVFKELITQKYIIKLGEKEYKIVKKEKLMSEWVTLFNKTLRPKLKQKKYKLRTSLEEFYTNCPIDSLGGELAGAELSNFLIPERAFFYTDKAFMDVMKEFKLIPSENGNLTLFEKFWSSNDTNNESTLVHPLLIYADLLNSPKPRNIETANIIYAKNVKSII